MNRLIKVAAATVTLSGFGLTSAHADYTPIFGGLSYDAPNGDGFNNPTAGFKSGTFVVGNGYATGYGQKYIEGINNGQTAFRTTPAGGTALGVLSTPPTLSGGSTIGSAVSLNGTVVGYSEKYSGSTDLGQRAVLWTAGNTTPVELQTLGTTTDGVGNAYAVGVSPNGSYVAGYAQKYTAAGAVVGDRAALWDSAGNIVELTIPGITDSSAFRPIFTQFYANAVNDSGVSVGQFNTGNGGGTRPARWTAAGVGTEMGNLGTANGLASGSANGFVYAVNSAGLSVGNSTKYTAGTALGSRAVRWDAAGVATELGNLGTYGAGLVDSSAVAINTAGVAAGTASLTGTNDRRAVKWGLDNVAVQLTSLPGGTTSSASSINDEGLVVGSSSTTSAGSFSKAVIWGTNNTPIDINQLIDPSLGWTLTGVSNITSENWVGGIGSFDPDGAGPTAAYSRSFLIQLPQTKLYFTGAQNSTLASAVGGVTNFSKDAAGSTVSSTVPGGYTDVYFGATAANVANFSTTLGTDLTVGTLTLGVGSHAGTPVTIAGANTLTINGLSTSLAAGTGIVINSGAAANIISANVAVGGSQSWTNSSASTFTVSGGVALGANTLTLAGSGAQTISGAVTGTGGITDTAAGTVTLSGANGYTGPTVMNSAAGTLVVATAARGPLLSGGGADIASGKVVFTYSGSSPASTIRGLLATSHAGGFATGMLRSSTATANKGLGYADNGAGVTVKAALYGDADLDGGVTIADFNALALSFGTSAGKVWVDGDFDYDGGVGIADFNALALNFGTSLPAADRAEAMAGLMAFAIAHDDLPEFYALTGVPEPTSLALLGLGAMVGLRRRRA